jgi:F-type H+-transporting ATPase subunit epsilon
MPTMLPESIHLEIVTPEERLLGLDVDEVVLPGRQGYLGVLPGHAPLLTELAIGELTYRRDNQRHYLSVAWGFAEVLPDRVSVLAEIAERAEEIDRERAIRARDRAKERLRERSGDIDLGRAQVALQKALIRIQVASRAGPERRE